MHPKLLELGDVSIYTYGFLIAFGAFSGYLYLSHTANKDLGVKKDTIQSLAILTIAMAFIGGKLFFYLAEPSFYFNPPSNMLHKFRTGFVFYGSLLFAIPSVIWFFRKNKLPVLSMLDLIAITTVIVHAFGRMGCFFAGCCYGIPSEGPFSITFTNELSKAPLHTSLHPTQLYSITLLLLIFLALLMFKRHKRFEGQLFFIYLIMYSMGRGIIEIFRGDLRRGFIVEEWLSHSQFIAIIIIGISVYLYIRFYKKSRSNRSVNAK